MQNSFPCPKCGAPLAPSGEVAVGAATFPVYQCDNDACAVAWLGVKTAYTFAVGPDGRPFDPAE